MATDFDSYALGKLGVDVDSSPVHADPNSLLKAQNAIRDVLGVDGGLKNRPGLVKFSGAGAGSLLGGITVPLFNYTDTRTLILAQFDGGSPAWVTTSNLFVASATSSAIAAWKDPSAYYSLATNVSRMGVFFNGQLYYAGSAYTMGTTSPVIRVYNGSDDRELCKVLPATTKGITGMFVCKGEMYVLTLDSGTTDADFVGSVYKLETNGHLTKQGDSLATGYVPTCIAKYNDKLFVGASRLTTTNEARVYTLDPRGTSSAWTAEVTMDADDYQITGFATLGGLLYCTTKNGGAATKGKIKQRSLAGSWSTVDSTTNNTGSYEDIIAWEGYLYASSRNYATTTTTAVIRRSSDGSTWATVANATATDGFGIFTIIGLRLFSMGLTKLQHTTNGTSWTTATPAGSGNVDGALGVLTITDVPDWEDPVDPGTQTINVTNVTQTSGITTTNLPTYGLAVIARDLTIAEFRTLNSVPITILSAPGAGFAHVCVAGWLELDIGTVFNVGTTINFFYTGSTTGVLTGITWTNAGNRYQMVAGMSSNGVTLGGGTNFHPSNKAVLIGALSDVSGGTVASTIRVTLVYATITANN